MGPKPFRNSSQSYICRCCWWQICTRTKSDFLVHDGLSCIDVSRVQPIKKRITSWHSAEHFYQACIFNFANFSRVTFSQPFSIVDTILLLSNVKLPKNFTSLEDYAKKVSDTLVWRAPMLNEYFAIDINPNGYVCALPCLLPQYIPDMRKLPAFLFRLGTEVCHEVVFYYHHSYQN